MSVWLFQLSQTVGQSLMLKPGSSNWYSVQFYLFIKTNYPQSPFYILSLCHFLYPTLNKITVLTNYAAYRQDVINDFGSNIKCLLIHTETLCGYNVIPTWKVFTVCWNKFYYKKKKRLWRHVINHLCIWYYENYTDTQIYDMAVRLLMGCYGIHFSQHLEVFPLPK